jgi:hypothetical protein
MQQMCASKVAEGQRTARHRCALREAVRGARRVTAIEDAAARALLDWARPGDVAVLQIHTGSVHQRLVATLTRAGGPS